MPNSEPLSEQAANQRENGRILLTAPEVAELLGVSAEWVWEQSRKGAIPTVTLGRSRRYRREAIEQWLAELERGP